MAYRPSVMESDGAREAFAIAEGHRSSYEMRLRDLLDQVAAGMVGPDEAAAALRDLPFSDLGFAKVDHHRELRQGHTEIVFAEGKTVDDVSAIVRRLLEGNEGPVLVSRASSHHVRVVRELAATAGHPVREAGRAGAVAIMRNVPSPTGNVLVITAGTSDLPVAEEAELTASMMGARTEVVADVGVAGLHRIASIRPRLGEADAIVVAAGMEGALASVVGGLVRCPVVACPTSVGYGANFGGLAALLAMLSSCAPGVVCVGIDDGVGAGYAAALIARGRASE
jgi:pyridinium-3,5-biscarboxylic acid mononucleotide synthase